jgi:hypothetical protein
MNNDFNSSKYIGTVPVDEVMQCIDYANREGWEWWVDGIPVLYRLYHFAHALRKKRPTLMFALDDSPTYSSKFDALSVSLPICPTLRVGKILDINGDYIVESKNITNGRYNVRSKGYRQLASENLDRAVTNGLRYFLPPSPQYIYSQYEHKTGLGLETIRNKARIEVGNALYTPEQLDRADYSSTVAARRFVLEMYPEFIHMATVGYEPQTPHVARAVKHAAQHGNELLRKVNYKPKSMAFVWVRDNSAVYRYTSINCDFEVVTDPLQMPEDIRNRMAVLDMAGDDDPIPDVGIRYEKYVYIIYL